MTMLQQLARPEPMKLTLDDFELLDRSGAFRNYPKVELIEGTIVTMNAQHRPHARAKTRLAFRLQQALFEIGGSLETLVEATVAMPPVNAPEPDILLTGEPEGDRFVPLASVALAIEIADTTASFDLREKAAIYARHGVPEYWVLEIRATTLHQFWSPSEKGYANSRTIRVGDAATSATIANLTIDTSNLI